VVSPIYLYNVTIDRAQFRNISADYGGVFVTQNTRAISAEIKNSEFDNIIAKRGGILFMNTVGGHTFSLQNCLISDSVQDTCGKVYFASLPTEVGLVRSPDPFPILEDLVFELNMTDYFGNLVCVLEDEDLPAVVDFGAHGKNFSKTFRNGFATFNAGVFSPLKVNTEYVATFNYEKIWKNFTFRSATDCGLLYATQVRSVKFFNIKFDKNFPLYNSYPLFPFLDVSFLKILFPSHIFLQHLNSNTVLCLQGCKAYSNGCGGVANSVCVETGDTRTCSCAVGGREG
jgi:hypothetical protein